MSRRRAKNRARAAVSNAAPLASAGGPLHASAEAFRYIRQNKHNPLPFLKPEMLSRALDAFEHGRIREAVLLWEKMAERDDVLLSVKPKREKDVSQLDMQVTVEPDSGEAGDEQQRVLKRFWKTVRSTNAYDRNERGGFRRLVKQMMTSTSFRYAVHHIIWDPQPDGELRATFEFVPLWLFENTTGKLRYLKSPGATHGEDLADGEWMVTTGDGLMIACSIGYLAKRSAFNDWLIFSEKFSVPGVLGRTSAASGTPEAIAMEEATQAFGHDWCAVITGDDGTHQEPIKIIQAEGNPAGMPMPAVIERVDRRMAALYRGADLSSMSSGPAGEGRGASLQEKETDILRRDDAETIAETLEEVSRQVIEWYFGAGTEVLARVELVVPVSEDSTEVVDAATKLADRGAKVSGAALMERLNLPEAKDDADALRPSCGEQKRAAIENADAVQDLRSALATADTAPADALALALLDTFSSQLAEVFAEGEEVENANGRWVTMPGGKRVWIDLAYDPEVQRQRGEAAVEKALKGQDVWDAMELEPEIGTVSFISPKAGSAAKGYHDGGGLLHLVNARNAQGQDGEKAARMMPRVLAYGRRGPAYGPANGRRMNITHKKHTAVLSLYLEGSRRTWLLTGFKDNPTQ